MPLNNSCRSPQGLKKFVIHAAVEVISLSLHLQRACILSLLSALHWSALTTDKSAHLTPAAIQTAVKGNSPCESTLLVTRALSRMQGKMVLLIRGGFQNFTRANLSLLKLKFKERGSFLWIYSMSLDASNSYTLDLSGCDQMHNHKAVPIAQVLPKVQFGRGFCLLHQTSLKL